MNRGLSRAKGFFFNYKVFDVDFKSAVENRILIGLHMKTLSYL